MRKPRISPIFTRIRDEFTIKRYCYLREQYYYKPDTGAIFGFCGLLCLLLLGCSFLGFAAWVISS